MVISHINSDNEAEVNNQPLVNESSASSMVECNQSSTELPNQAIGDESNPVNGDQSTRNNEYNRDETANEDVITQSTIAHDRSIPAAVYPPYVEGAAPSVNIASNGNLISIDSENNWYEASGDTPIVVVDPYNDEEHENNDVDLGNESYASALRAASSVLYQNSTPATNDWQDQNNRPNSSTVIDTSNSSKFCNFVLLIL